MSPVSRRTVTSGNVVVVVELVEVVLWFGVAPTSVTAVVVIVDDNGSVVVVVGSCADKTSGQLVNQTGHRNVDVVVAVQPMNLRAPDA